MLQNLADTSPYKIWASERFQATLDLIGGRQIVVRFDMQSNTEMFNAEMVIEEFGDSILADIENDYGEFLSVASTIATVLNKKIEIVAEEVMRHRDLTDAVLGALEAEDYINAAIILDDLVVSLLIFEPQASPIWTAWIYKVYRFIDMQSSLGFFGI